MSSFSFHFKPEATDLSWQSFEGATALLVAAEEGHKDVMKLLLDHGAKPNVPDSMDQYPLLAGTVQNFRW